VNSPVWNSRPCSSGASATRATYFADGRFSRNDVLPCLWKNGTMLETLRWSAAKQREIQNARKVTHLNVLPQGQPPGAGG